MPDLLYFIASVGFLIWIARKSVYWGIILEEHDYSFRSVFHFLQTTFSGRKILNSPISYLKWILLLLYPFIIFHEEYSYLYHLVICGLYLYETLRVLTEVHEKQMIFKRFFSIKRF